MKKVFVEEIRERDWVDSPFLVRDKIMAMAKNGKPYMTLKLVDRSGEIEGRVWDRVDELAGTFQKDDFVRIQGKTSVYLGKMQLVVQDLQRLADDSVELADFLPVSRRDPEEMKEDLASRIASLTNPYLRQLMEAFLADRPLLERYRTAPAAKAMHHVFIGGLLEHSLAVAYLADDICHRYPDLDRDLLVTGALLHDVGKVAELSYSRSFDYTDEGKLLGHIVIGVELVEEKIRTVPDFPRDLAVLLKHMLLSHHGQYEFGSPKRPKTLEATILNFLDDLDSKINGIRTHIDREPDNSESWTNYHRLYDRYFFKGAKAPGEGPAARTAPVQAPAAPPGEQVKPAADRGPRRSGPKAPENRRSFGFTLGDQLKGKSLDLFTAEDEE